jgi:hypothetical protein
MGQHRPKRLTAFFLTLAATLLIAVSPSSSRPWKPDAKAIAEDYAQILDHKPNGEIVLLWWIVPQTMLAPSATQVLDQYVIIGMVDARITPTGQMTFANLSTLDANDAKGKPLKLLGSSEIPPTITGFLAAMQQALAQSLGAMGQGIHWFVFDGAGVHACGAGGLAIPFGGETYTYDTPIPGCPKI